MISQINNNVKDIQINNRNRNRNREYTPSFNGGFVDAAVKGIQHCEKNPMLNVAVIDLATAIIPRTIWESFTNIFAGFEAFRRESSGLIVNCLLPGFIALGAAKLTNKAIMGSKSDLSNCWAGNDTINTVSEYYNKASETSAYQEGMTKFNDAKKARVYAAHYNMLSGASGADGDVTKAYKDIEGLNISDMAEKLTGATFENPKKLTFKEKMSDFTAKVKNVFEGVENKKSLVDEAFEQTASKTHITENVKFGSGKNTVVTDLKSAMKNSTNLMRGFIKDGVENTEQVGAFAKKAKKLVKTKSGIAMAVIIPVAASMQYINRWITTKMSGVKGAPIYNDYTKNREKQTKTPGQEKAEKSALLKQKFISIGSMVGVSLLSMMKLPTPAMLKNIVQFKGQFPTMDQARAISTVTFSSRMAAADDKNELAESTTRDIVTFSSMYFLGDYAAKGYASYLENTKGVKLLNRVKQPKKDANFLQKAGNWIVNTHLKSTDELAADGVRSLADMKHLRAKCQAVNLGSSLLILGLLVPIYTRLKTHKNHKKDLLAQQNSDIADNLTENKSGHKQNDKFSYYNANIDSTSTFTAFRQTAKERK
ncbi:MAG: hypothetical protein LUB59_05325 [Candidatus Gastranaerophilales bacterium]|nr:hypothetical protein [Candidatus Gastranaerophilales bacterium]